MVLITKIHTCEVGGVHLRILDIHVFMNLKNNYFLGLKSLHTGIFIIIISYYNITSAKFIAITIHLIKLKNLILNELH